MILNLIKKYKIFYNIKEHKILKKLFQNLKILSVFIAAKQHKINIIKHLPIKIKYKIMSKLMLNPDK